MSKNIIFRASDNPLMFQIFKRYIHQTDSNEFYCDGTCVEDNPGVMVNFKNINHTYEIFNLLSQFWGGWNACPSSSEMYVIAKNWEERFQAEIIGIGYDSIDFKLNRELSDTEIDLLINEIREVDAEANCTGGFAELKNLIKEKSEFYVWWD